MHVGTVDTEREIGIPEEDRYEWVGDPGEAIISENSAFGSADYQQAFRLAKLMTVKFHGFIGSTDLLESSIDTKHGFWLPGKQRTRAGKRTTGPYSDHSKKGKWSDQVIWQISRTKNGDALIIGPSRWMERRITGSRTLFTLNTAEPEAVVPVLTAMLLALQGGRPKDIV